MKLQEAAKNRKLNDLLDSLEFNQVSPRDCLLSSALIGYLKVCIFVKSVNRATQLDALLRDCNFPSICIHSGLPQAERIKKYQQFKAFEKRILVATDIFGRGIDVERVNSKLKREDRALLADETLQLSSTTIRLLMQTRTCTESGRTPSFALGRPG